MLLPIPRDEHAQALQVLRAEGHAAEGLDVYKFR